MLFSSQFLTMIAKQLPSEVRATMLSVYSMMFSLSMIVIFPLTGWLIDYFGFDWTFIALGSFLLATTPFLHIALKKICQNLQEV